MRGKRMAASGQDREGGCSWKDMEDEGPHFKIKGWIKVPADVYPPPHTQTH